MTIENQVSQTESITKGHVKSLKTLGSATYPDIDLRFTAGTNVLIGPNGAGKTFALDTLYRGLSKMGSEVTLHNFPLPHPARGAEMIRVGVLRGLRVLPHPARGAEMTFHRDTPGAWGPPVLYARSDGSYSARCEADGQLQDVHLTQEEALNGAWGKSEGMIRDLGQAFGDPGSRVYHEAVSETLAALSIPIKRGFRQRGDARTIPTLGVSGTMTPLPGISAGLLRVASMVYMIAWTRREYEVAAGMEHRLPSSRFVVLIDEPEAHVHIDMQRSLPAALAGMAAKLGMTEDIQFVYTTHSPVFLTAAQDLQDIEELRYQELELPNSG